jgi:hypothetical protein
MSLLGGSSAIWRFAWPMTYAQLAYLLILLGYALLLAGSFAAH